VRVGLVTQPLRSGPSLSKVYPGFELHGSCNGAEGRGSSLSSGRCGEIFGLLVSLLRPRTIDEIRNFVAYVVQLQLWSLA
jgi:hypothetical protein